MNYMELLGDLPEDLVDCAFRTADSESPQEQRGQAIRMTKGAHTMKKQRAEKAKQAPLRIGRAGIAAAVALCLGLNGALIYGISRMKASDSVTPGAAVSAESEVQDIAKPYMELNTDVTAPLPTGIMINIINRTEQDHIPYNPVYIVTQNGEKVADCEPYTVFFDDIARGESLQRLCFEQLPAGSYTLVNLAEDGETEGILGHLDFEISDVFDSMIWIPDVYGMQYEEAAAMLADKGVSVVMEGQILGSDADVDIGAVTFELVPPYNTEYVDGGAREYSYSDGEGYWVNPGDEIKLFVNIGAKGDPTTVPDIMGMDWEAAKKTLMDHGLVIDKRTRYDDEVPSGQPISIDPEPGTEAAIGSTVYVTVSLGQKAEIPDVTGMDWESAKQIAEESGVLPLRYLIDSDEYPAGTVVKQSEVSKPCGLQSFVVLQVVKKEGEQNIVMKFSYSGQRPDKKLYYCLRDESQKIIGVTLPADMEGDGFATDYMYPDCSKEHTLATAYLVDWETNREEYAGSYILHPETASYETVDEDIESAFRAFSE